MNLPSEFIARMSDSLPDHQDFLKSYSDEPLAGLRVNRLKTSPEELKRLISDIRGPVGWCTDGFYYSTDFRPGKSPYYHAGLYYIQEPSAMLPATVMDVGPGQRVLDLCAAPGGKSTQILAKLAGEGILIANDVSASRARALLKNIELSGAGNCVITNETPSRLAERFSGYFDRILVDAPCSGEGMFRRDPTTRKAWTVRKPEICATLQREILHYAAMMLKPGGRLMYSTCTFAPTENELMTDEFLAAHKDFVGVAIPHAEYGVEPGLSSKEYTARIWPHRQKGEGHFMAYMQRSAGISHKPAEGAPYPIHEREGRMPASHFRSSHRNAGRKGISLTENAPQPGREYADFCNKHLNIAPGPTYSHGYSLYKTPKGLPDLSGLRVLRTGLYLGDLLTKRFEPSQAFAMSLYSNEVKPIINFSITDNNLDRYLKGESFEHTCAGEKPADGWNLITLNNFPLGWAKVTDGRLKNKYPKGWLMSLRCSSL